MPNLAGGLVALALFLICALPAHAGLPCDIEIDADCDGVADFADNCRLVHNPPPFDCDVDEDGYGNACDCDPANDFVCGGTDFAVLNVEWGQMGPDLLLDMNCDGAVGGPDFGTFLMMWGGRVGESGLACAGTIPCP